MMMMMMMIMIIIMIIIELENERVDVVKKINSLTCETAIKVLSMRAVPSTRVTALQVTWYSN